MKFNQFVEDAAEKFEVAQAVNFVDLAKQTQLPAQFSHFIKGNKFTLRRLDWRD